MTKRVLVVDCGINDFQYMVVDLFGDNCKLIQRYRKLPRGLHGSSSSPLHQLIVDIFNDTKCDEIYMDIMGTSLGVYDGLPEEIKNVTYGYKQSLQGNSDRICAMINDFRSRNVFIPIDSMLLGDVIGIIGDERSFCRDDRGFIKIDKSLDYESRDKLHMILGMYKN